jgi:hypothetical protein
VLLGEKPGIGIRALVLAVLPYRHVQEISRAFSALPAKARFHARESMHPDEGDSLPANTHPLPNLGKNSGTASYVI